jgi:hypothetical protein
MNETRPSYLKIFWIDYGTFVPSVFALVAGGLYLYDLLGAPDPSPNFRLWMLGLAGAGLAAAVWRSSVLIALYDDGQETNAVVNDIGFFRDRGYIQYVYAQGGQKYQGRMQVMKNKFTRAYKIGDQIAVMVDRENPRRSMIKNLFI